jgi:flagellar hook-basal body complex protein FliE
MNLDNNNYTINGYYLSPALLYKSTSLTGSDENLKALLEKDVTMSFTDLLKQSISTVNNLQTEADGWATRFATGETDNIHQVLIAGQKAEMALQLATAVRSKIMDAYTEIMRMQI